MTAPLPTLPSVFLVSSIGDLQLCRGTFTLNGTATVTVANPLIDANSMFFKMWVATLGGTLGAEPVVTTVTPGVGFTVVGTASDTSVYNYAFLM